MITLFSKHLHWLDIKEMAHTTADLGFDGVDLTIRPNGHVTPEKVEEDLPKAVEYCKQAGVEVVMLATTICDAAQPFTEKILKTAAGIGIKHYRMDWYHYNPEISIERNHADIKTRMSDLAAMNEHYKIKGSYQNHDGDWFGAPVWDLALVMKEINSEWLGCQYDILNATLEGNNSWPIALEYIAPFIHSIDIKDAQWSNSNGNWNLKYVPLGKGGVDFKKFFQLMRKFKVNVPFSLHLEYDLGGAEVGAKNISIPAKDVISAIKEDLKTLKNYLSEN